MKPWIVCLLFACLNFVIIITLQSEISFINWFGAGFAYLRHFFFTSKYLHEGEFISPNCRICNRPSTDGM